MIDKQKFFEFIDKTNSLFCGDKNNIHFENISHYQNGDYQSLVFVDEVYHSKFIQSEINEFSVLVTNYSKEKADLYFKYKSLVISENPKLIFSLLSSLLEVQSFSYPKNKKEGIHPDAKIGENVFIGPNTYIGKCVIENNTYIAGNCFIHDEVYLGENCFIDCGVVLGVEGTGHIFDHEFGWVKFPQVGKTIIEENVTIGANSYVTKGSLLNTHIKKGCVIGLNCGVGHNVILNENVMLLAKSLIGGSCEIGKKTIIGVMSCIRDTLKIGENSFVGMGSVVTKNIPNDEVWVGNPARFFKVNKTI
jgi:UDP-3-O-[3-hydroxymyristoyl] glucosamine N-acyltransferase